MMIMNSLNKINKVIKILINRRVELMYIIVMICSTAIE